MFINVLLLICLNCSQTPDSRTSLAIIDPVKLDEWHDLRFGDEKARLDNVSIVWKGRSQHIIYLVIYAGQRACVGEAKARGVRAKNYLIRRNVPAANVVVIDGGFRSEVTTQVWIWPPVAGQPPVFAEESTDVKLEKGCKIKFRGGPMK